jgi:hypothetical protein
MHDSINPATAGLQSGALPMTTTSLPFSGKRQSICELPNDIVLTALITGEFSAAENVRLSRTVPSSCSVYK